MRGLRTLLAVIVVIAISTACVVKWQRLSALRERAAYHACFVEFFRMPASSPLANPFDRRSFAEHEHQSRKHEREMQGGGSGSRLTRRGGGGASCGGLTGI